MRRMSCLVFVIVLMTASMTLAAEQNTQAFKVPVLWCTQDGSASGLSWIEFSLTREAGSRSPLIVAVAEDTPSGTGESLRASVWQACMVAALCRHDDLSGVRLSLTFRGRSDGASAGAVICLAILSALDGRSLPEDVAMTGTVLPDGTVGRVGGIPHKMRAARAKGIKRVILPAFMRFDMDLATETAVDLKALARSLNLSLVQADDVEDAYAILHQLPEPGAARLGRDVAELPEAFERSLLTEYRQDMKTGGTVIARLAGAGPEQVAVRGLPVDRITRGLMTGELGRVMFESPRTFAETALQSGNFLSAQSQARFWASSLRVLEAENALLKATGSESNAEETLRALDKRILELVRGLPDPSLLVARAEKLGVSNAATQLFSHMSDYVQVLGAMSFLNQSLEMAKQQAAASENPEFQKQLQAHSVQAKTMQLLLAGLLNDYMRRYVEDTARQSRLLPDVKFTGDPRSVERIFYSAWLAAHNTLEKEVIEQAAKGWKCSSDQAWWILMQSDNSLAGYTPATRMTQALHEQVQKESSPPFGIAVAAQSHLNAFAEVSGVVVRFVELDARPDGENRLRYERTPVLSHLIATARQKALVSISKCRQLNIPCITPIAYLQHGDMTRDDPDSDKVAVLVSYWKASLQAKALLMLFGEGRSTGPSRGSR